MESSRSTAFELLAGAGQAPRLQAPFARSWDTSSVADGTHILEAVARDVAGNTGTTCPVQVTVQNPHPKPVTLTAPLSGVNWGLSSVQTVTFTHTLGDAATFRVQLSRDGGSSFEDLALAVPSPDGVSGSFAWTVSGPPTKSAFVRVFWNDLPEVFAVNDDPFTIAMPFVVVSVPNGSETWMVGAVETATWAHNLGSGAKFRVELSRNGGATWSVLSPAVGSARSTSAAYDWLVSGPGTGRARLHVSWTGSSSVFDRSDGNFVIR